MEAVLTRAVIAELALLSEGAVMFDLPPAVWAEARISGALRQPLMSREKPVFFAPASLDGYKERPPENAATCEVRRRAAQCVLNLCSKYDADFVEWIDTAKGTEKQAVVLRIQLGGRNVLLIAWRGSKTRTDWVTTDANMQFVRLQPRRPAARAKGPAATTTTDAAQAEAEAEADAEAEGEAEVEAQAAAAEAAADAQAEAEAVAGAEAPTLAEGETEGAPAERQPSDTTAGVAFLKQQAALAMINGMTTARDGVTEAPHCVPNRAPQPGRKQRPPNHPRTLRRECWHCLLRLSPPLCNDVSRCLLHLRSRRLLPVAATDRSGARGGGIPLVHAPPRQVGRSLRRARHVARVRGRAGADACRREPTRAGPARGRG